MRANLTDLLTARAGASLSRSRRPSRRNNNNNNSPATARRRSLQDSDSRRLLGRRTRCPSRRSSSLARWTAPFVVSSLSFPSLSYRLPRSSEWRRSCLSVITSSLVVCPPPSLPSPSRPCVDAPHTLLHRLAPSPLLSTWQLFGLPLPPAPPGSLHFLLQLHFAFSLSRESDSADLTCSSQLRASC